MVKIQIKRVKRSTYYEYNRIDSRFVNGAVATFPEPGQNVTIFFDHLGWGAWHTSLVTEVIPRKSLIVMKTSNSTYHIKKGWKKSKTYVD